MPGHDFPDDPDIPDDTLLLRRIVTHKPGWVAKDGATGALRPSSGAFEDHPNGTPMSVVLENKLREAGRPLEDALSGHDGFALAAITAGQARALGLRVAVDPQDDEPAHGIVIGKKTQGIKRKLARAAQWIVPPDDNH